ncbi:MAG: electron transport complex subunit RsxE [Gammaproteobacteria bacterium]|nr:electron transport complex subunit RsxE [Gammaproteobacteria bacterium]MDH3767479.1 electron transport complex subunit RsxE [Gammaproteobacteria bacterium]
MAQPTTNQFIKGLWQQNPIFVQALGLCPALAVSNSAINALTMGLATSFVLLSSGVIISSIRSLIPREARIVSYICIIASLVTTVDYVIKAISLDLHKSLGAFISLIVVNCLILGRAEAFASRNTVGKTVLDSAGMGAGFTIALLCIGVIREVLGAGTLFGIGLFPDTFQTWTIMLLPSGGFFVLAFWLLAIGLWNDARERSAKTAEETA